MSQSAPRPLRILYAAGPGDVIGTYRHWSRGNDDPHEVARTYSGQFFDVCKDLGAKAYVITTRPGSDRLTDNNIIIEDRPVRGLKAGGLGYHLGQIRYGLGLTSTAIRRRVDVAVVSTGTHWFALTAMSILGVRVVPALHCALWPVGRPPARKLNRLIAKLDGWFWRFFAHATICVSPECERQARQISGKPKGKMLQVRAQYRQGYLDALAPPRWAADGSFNVMYAGRIERNKGVFGLIEIAKRLHAQRPGRFTWDICGVGSALEELRQAADKAAVAEIFKIHGKLDRGSMAKAFERSHAVIVPTTADFAEGLNKVCVESILAGRPVVTSIHSNALDVLGAAAIEVNSGDTRAYGDALLKLADDRAAYETSCTACQNVQGQFYDPTKSWGEALRAIAKRVAN